MPTLREVRTDIEIGIGKKSNKLIWLACPDCGIERWVYLSEMRKPNHTGLCHKCTLLRRNGQLQDSPNWKGGVKHCGGKVYIWLPPDHPFASMRDNLGYVLRHRLLMAEQLGRPLLHDETIHHRNEVSGDDRNENLKRYSSNSSHVSHHRKKEIRERGERPRDALGRFLVGGYNNESN